MLWLVFTTDQTLHEITCMLDAGAAPVIEILERGSVTAVYMNHALTRLQMETVGGKRRVEAALSVAKQPVPDEESTEALKAGIAVLKADVKQMSEALAAIEEGIADA